MKDLALPAFEMDCRDWIVVEPEEGMPFAGADAPVLAVLSSVIIDEDINEVTGSLTVVLLDDDEPLQTRAVAPGATARELFDTEDIAGIRRYVMPAPGPDKLALFGEFYVDDVAGAELDRRVDQLMTSFRWQA